MSARTHFVDSSLSVARADVLHFLGYPDGHEPRPRIADLLDECLAEARGLVRGRGRLDDARRRTRHPRSASSRSPPAGW